MAPFYNSPYHVYHDLNVVNNDYTNNSAPHLRFEESRDASFLDGDAADYFVSIIRFSIQTANYSLPVFIPMIDKTASDINTTIYKISFVYTATGVSYSNTLNVMFSPTVDYSSGPLPYNYYYIYDYLEIIKMINSTFDKLMTTGSIASAVNAFTSNSFATFIELDPNTQKCSITADKQFFVNRYNGKQFSDNPQISVYFNKALRSILPSFPYKFNSNTGDMNYLLIFEDLYGMNTIQVGTNILSTLQNSSTAVVNKPGIQIFQEISPISIWNPVDSIVFTTSLLPIVPSQTSLPKIYDNVNSNLKINGYANISNIITDFQISIVPGNDYRDNITYIPKGEYRLIDMFSSYNLNKIDLIVYWKDIFGNLNQLFLQPGSNANVKLLFRKKHFYLA